MSSNSMPRGAQLLDARARAAQAPDRHEWAWSRRRERRWMDKKEHVALAGFISS